MGCWNETCAISNLPIGCRDDVYFLLLSKNPYRDKEGRTGTYYNDHWFLRALPLQARYNDYGSIEDWEEGWVLDGILEQFKKDLVEVEQTDRDRLLDIPAVCLQNLNFPLLLEWLREGKVKARRTGAMSSKDEPPLSVVQILVLKDVWDSMLEMSKEDWLGEVSFNKMKKDIDLYLKQLKERAQKLKESDDPLKLSLEFQFERQTFENSFSAPFNAAPYPGPPGTMNIEFFKKQLDERFMSDDIDEIEAYEKYKRIGEVLHVEQIMSYLRKGWYPTIGSGSQNADYDMTIDFNLRVSALAYKEELESLAHSEGFLEEELDEENPDDFAMSVQKQKRKLYSIPKRFQEEVDRINVEMEKKCKES